MEVTSLLKYGRMDIGGYFINLKNLCILIREKAVWWKEIMERNHGTNFGINVEHKSAHQKGNTKERCVLNITREYHHIFQRKQ